MVACKSPGAAQRGEPPKAHVAVRRAGATAAPREVFEVGSVEAGKALVAGLECNRCRAGTIQSGGVDARGERARLFGPTPEGLPLLVAALVARQRESSGQESGDVRGMPLGLPALSAPQIQLVESWVAQGRPL